MQIFVGAPNQPVMGASEVFLVLFVTLGPINFVKLFATLTKDAPATLQRQIAVRASLIATISLVLSAIVGKFSLSKWHISVGAIALTGAIVLFIVAMKALLELYSDRPRAPTSAPSIALAVSPLAFPSIATPYGIAVLIVLLTLAPGTTLAILGLAVLVMVLDLLFMLFVKPIMRAFGVPLSLLGVVLSLMQVALSIQFALFAIRTIAANGA